MLRGSKRKPGKRYPCGRRMREEIERDAMSTVLEARKRHFGVSIKEARDERLGTALGRLAFKGLISDLQYQAGVAFGVPCTNVEIVNLRCSSPSACIAIGSEMSGGIENVTVHGGLFCDQGDQALNVKSAVGRGGYVRNVLFRDAVLGGGKGTVKTALQAADNYVDNFPPVPIDPKLIPLLSNITALNVSVAPGGTVQHAGAFAGLGVTVPAGEIVGIFIDDIALGSALEGWACANVTGGSGANVQPDVCSQLAG